MTPLPNHRELLRRIVEALDLAQESKGDGVTGSGEAGGTNASSTREELRLCLPGRKIRRNPRLDGLHELRCPLDDLIHIVRGDDSLRVVGHAVSLAAAAVKVVGRLLVGRPKASGMTANVVWWAPRPLTRYPAHAIAIWAANSAAWYAIPKRLSSDSAAIAASSRFRLRAARRSSSSALLAA
jgi:hypothetical protein